MSDLTLSELGVLISRFLTISEDEKKRLLNILENDEEFPENFWEEIERIFDEEIAFAEDQEKKVGEKSTELENTKKNRTIQIQKMHHEFSNLCESEFQKFETEAKEIAKKSDEKSEKIVHASENNEIDIIRKKLGISS